MSVYERNGYRDRADYLQSLSEDSGCPVEVVESVADVLGDGEDFDGLVTMLDDWEDWME